MKGFVLDNYLESKKIPLAVKTEEGEEDDFFVTFQIFRLILVENNHIRVFKCNFYSESLQINKT